MENMNLRGTFILGFDLSKEPDREAEGCLLVGIRDGQRNRVVNMFTGEEALDIYRMITTKKPKKEKKTNE